MDVDERALAADIAAALDASLTIGDAYSTTILQKITI